MTEQEALIISRHLDGMENAVDTLTGVERRHVCELMQQLSTLTGNTYDLEECREELRLDMLAQGAGWPAPEAASLARPADVGFGLPLP